jgi:hypothetical protein
MGISKVSGVITRKSTSLVALSALVLFIVFTATVLPIQSEKAREQSGESSPDMSFLITVDELYAIAESYGQDGRNAYVLARFTFDLVWPIVYTLFLTSSISWLFSKSFDNDSSLQNANLVPVIGLALDYLENISASIVMLRYPMRTPLMDILAVLFTPMKWVFVGGSFIVVLIGIVKYGMTRVMGIHPFKL